ncbi:MAG: hypothetical protein IT578_00110 [Verrucomicrobiae bacterium]|nr:hypothetical protein [Verrucomicrobiae bacterium]
MKTIPPFFVLPRMCVWLLALLAGGGSAFAQDSYWNGTSGDFANATKWNAGVPNASSNAFFTNSATYTVSWTANATSANVYVNTKSASAVLSEQLDASLWWVTNQYLIGQSGNTGSVTHGSGTLVVTNAAGTGLFVVGDAGSKGTLTLTGGTVIVDKLWATNVSTSTLSLRAGDLVTQSGGSIVNVGSLRLSLGNVAGQTMTWTMRGGGTNLLLTTPQTLDTQIGNAVGAYGRLIITDPGTIYTNAGSTSVGGGSGGAGRGMLVVSNGGRGWGGNLHVGNGGASTNNDVIITGPNSRWNASGTLNVGYVGATNNLVQILDGGALVAIANANVGTLGSGLNNRVIVSGTNSLLSVADLYVGTNPTANASLVLVKDAATLAVVTRMTAGPGIISNLGGVFQFGAGNPIINTNVPGSIVLSNGVVSFKGVSDAVVNGQITKFTFLDRNTLRLDGTTNSAVATYAIGTNAGTTFASLNLTGNNSLFQNTTLTVDEGGVLSGSGKIGSVNATNRGVISPGNSPGTLVFASNLTLLDSSTLNIELGGTNSSLYDRLQVLGSLTLTGSLNVSLINGFVPSGTNEFDVLDWGALVGTFGSVTLPVGYDWDTSNLYTTGTLSLLAIPEPSALAAGVAGLLLLAFLRRRS